MIKGSIKHTMRLLGATVAVMTLLLGAAVWRVSSGPVQLNFLLPYAVEKINAELPSGNLTAKELFLIWRMDRRTLDLIGRGVAYYPSESSEPIVVPFVEVALDGPSLVQGRLSPSDVFLDQISLKVTRSVEGLFTIGDIDIDGLLDDEERNLEEDLVGIIVDQMMGDHPDRKVLSRLKSLEVADTDILFEDQRIGLTWHVPDGELILARGEKGLAATLGGDVRIEEQDWRIDLIAVYHRDNRKIAYDLSFKDVEPALLSSQADILKSLSAFAFPVNGQVDGMVDLNTGRFGAMDISLVLGRGALLLPQDLEYDHDILLDGGEFTIRHVPQERIVDITSFEIKMRDRSFSGEAALQIGETVAASSYKLRLSTDRMNLSDLIYLWPVGLSRSAYDWMSENMNAGEIYNVNLTAASDDNVNDEERLTESDGGLRLTFDFDSTEASYLKPLPVMTEAQGRGVLTADTFELSVDKARVGNLSVKDARMFLPDINADVPDAKIDLVVSGKLPEVLDLLDREPFRLVSDYGVDPQKVGGKSATRLSLQFPLDNNLSVNQLKFAAASRVVDVSLTDFQEGISLSDGDLVLKVNGDGLSAEGEMSVNQVPMSVFWSEDFTGKQSSPTVYKLAGTLTGEQITSIGLPVADYIRGEVDVDLTMRAGENGLDTLTGQAVLDRARLLVDPVDWEQKPDHKGSARFAVRFPKESGPFVNSFAMLVGDLELSGSVQLRPDNSIENFRMKKAVLGKDTILSALLERREDLGYNLTVQGDSMDARPLLEKLEGTLGEEERAPLSVWVSVNKVKLYNDERLRNLKGIIRDDGSRIQVVDLSAAIESGGYAALKMSPNQKGYRTGSIRSDNAGGLLRAFDTITTLRGGDLSVDVVVDDETDAELTRGQVSLKNFIISDTPLLARLLTVGSLTGINDLLQGEGIRFSELNAKIRSAKDWWAVDDGYAIGPAIGITAKGTVDQKKSTYDIGGTLVPAYTLNSLLGYIPLVGNILVGKKGEGVFAFTYGIKGTKEKPVVTVNPLAALAPGFLRNIFGLEGKTPDDTSKPQQPKSVNVKPNSERDE